MTYPDILTQFSTLPVARFTVVLRAEVDAVLPPIIGSTLRGAFGHALKAVSCSMEHRDCAGCFVSDACVYSTIFEPVTNGGGGRDVPRPFVFEPPVPRFTPELSRTENLRLGISKGGRISFGLLLIGDALFRLPYFVMAFELMSRRGLGAARQVFSLDEVRQIDAAGQEQTIRTRGLSRPSAPCKTTLADFVATRLDALAGSRRLRIVMQTPLRIRREKQLVEHFEFGDIFKQCSLRLKFLSENFGVPFVYDYGKLTDEAYGLKTSKDLWRHEMSRRTNRQKTDLDLNGMLGEMVFPAPDNPEVLSILIAGEALHIGSASAMGQGKFSVRAD